MSAFEVMLAFDADDGRADSNRRIGPVEEILGRQFGPPRKVELDRNQ